MITTLLIIALIGTMILVFHVSLELNGLEKKIGELGEVIRKHYERKRND
jgi:hypothetical protein